VEMMNGVNSVKDRAGKLKAAILYTQNICKFPHQDTDCVRFNKIFLNFSYAFGQNSDTWQPVE
jgi:hypothetical protein